MSEKELFEKYAEICDHRQRRLMDVQETAMFCALRDMLKKGAKLAELVNGPTQSTISHDDWYALRNERDALAARLASADIEATSLLMAMVQQWPDVHPDWKPLPDVAGKITQINNMVAGLRARLAEAEHLILRMAGEDYQRARFYVEKYDLTGERAAVSADDAPEKCLDCGKTIDLCGCAL